MKYTITTKCTITTRPTKKGLAFDLYVRLNGKRERPLLGYNLTKAQADQAASDMIAKLRTKEQMIAPRSMSPLFEDFLTLFWQTMRVKKRFDLRRPESIIETHLLPCFGDRRLDSLTAEDGLAYITARLEAKAAPWTIRREWTVLMRILNLAVDFDKLDKNRLKRVELPDVQNRQRVATKEELLAIKQESDKRRLKKIQEDKYDPSEFWRIVTIALNTGLREAKILEIDRTWLRKRDDGWWLILPPARSRLKQTPREIPLTPAAYEALRSDIAHVDGRIFRRWSAGAFGTFWRRLSRDAKVADLHFHDLRHTFATWLQNLGVPLEVRATLLGHRLRGAGADQLGGDAMTVQYSLGGHGWNQQLRHAVTLLQTGLLSYGLSYGRPAEDQTSHLKVVNASKGERNSWWSQRDLNPCLSLERAPS
jgi:integrase